MVILMISMISVTSQARIYMCRQRALKAIYDACELAKRNARSALPTYLSAKKSGEICLFLEILLKEGSCFELSKECLRSTKYCSRNDFMFDLIISTITLY